MAKVKIGNMNQPFVADAANTTYVLDAKKSVTGMTNGIESHVDAPGRKFRIDGRIDVDQIGMEFGDNSDPLSDISIFLGETGRISGGRAIEIYGDGHRIDNAGEIKGIQGIVAMGDDLLISNSGTIEVSGAGIVCSGDVKIVNTGEISGTDYGIVVNVSATGAVVRNAGTIEGELHAFVGSSSGERLVNSGRIIGDVYLAGGSDVFVFKKGRIEGEVEGGHGDDTYVIGKQDANIFEKAGQGFDFVKSSVSLALADNIEQLNLVGRKDIDATGNEGFNHIQGNAGRNTLHGGGGEDFLVSGAGNDKLFGDAGADIFNFQKGTARDVVMDFEAGVDEIQLGGLKGATDFTDMLDNHAVEKDGDVWITYGKDTVVLRNIDKQSLIDTDFVFG